MKITKREAVKALKSLDFSNPQNACDKLAKIKGNYSGQDFTTLAAETLGKSNSYISRMLRISAIPPVVRKHLDGADMKTLESVSRKGQTIEQKIDLAKNRPLSRHEGIKGMLTTLTSGVANIQKRLNVLEAKAGVVAASFKPAEETITLPKVPNDSFSQKDINKLYGFTDGRRGPGLIAKALKIIGDPTYGMENPVATGRGVKGHSWLFNKEGLKLIKPYMQRLAEEHAKFLVSGSTDETAFKKATEIVLKRIQPVGNGTWDSLTKNLPN